MKGPLHYPTIEAKYGVTSDELRITSEFLSLITHHSSLFTLEESKNTLPWQMQP
jgi:hypothetical protein